MSCATTAAFDLVSCLKRHSTATAINHVPLPKPFVRCRFSYSSSSASFSVGPLYSSPSKNRSRCFNGSRSFYCSALKSQPSASLGAQTNTPSGENPNLFSIFIFFLLNWVRLYVSFFFSSFKYNLLNFLLSDKIFYYLTNWEFICRFFFSLKKKSFCYVYWGINGHGMSMLLFHNFNF
jgi:hypothetical protein